MILPSFSSLLMETFSAGPLFQKDQGQAAIIIQAPHLSFLNRDKMLAFFQPFAALTHAQKEK